MVIKSAKAPPAGARQRLKEIADRVAALPALDALWLFGSYARGEETPLSDVDLAYLMRPGAEQAEQDVALYRTLSAHFGTDELTLLDLAGAGPAVAFRVLQEGKLLFCRNAQTVADLTEAVLARHSEIRRLVAEALRNDQEATVEIDRDKVLAQLRLVEADLSRLREKASIVEAAYLADLDAQDVVMRRFQTAVETCASIGNHLIARLRLRLAEDYAGVFSVLGEAGILDRGLAARMAELARFRNLLVHLYWRVDHTQVFRRMQERIRLLEEFQESIRAFLRRQTAI